MQYNEIIKSLYVLKDIDKVKFKEKNFGIISNHSLGIYHKELKKMAKNIGVDNELALKLFNSGIYEGRILCSILYKPKDITPALMEKWVKTFENWEICDSFCMGLFAKSDYAIIKIQAWTRRENEFEKRAGFVIMAAYCMADKQATNEIFESFFSIIIREANDSRQYVKKAVNWALRNIGKRNSDLNKQAIIISHKILSIESKSAKWIAKNALSELSKSDVNILDYPRSTYRALP